MRYLYFLWIGIFSVNAQAEGVITQMVGNITVLVESRIAPLTIEDQFRVPANQDSTLNMLVNDHFADIVDVSILQSENSSAVWDPVGQVIVYSPATDFRGIDTIQYALIDEEGVQTNFATIEIEVVIGKAQNPVITPANRVSEHLVWLDGNSSSVTVSVNSSPGTKIILEFVNRDTGEATTNVEYTQPFTLYSNTRVAAKAYGPGYEESDFTIVNFLFCEENSTQPWCGYVAPEASEVAFGWAANTIKVGQTAVFNWSISNVTSCIEELSSEQGHNARPGNGSVEYRFDNAGEIQAKWHCLDINNDHIYPDNADFRLSTLTVEKLDRVSGVSAIRGYQTNSAIVDWQAVPFAHSYQIQTKTSAASYWSVVPVCTGSVGAQMCFDSIDETSAEVKNMQAGGRAFRLIACIQGSCENTATPSAKAFVSLPSGGMKSVADVIEIDNTSGETVLNVSQNDTSPYSGSYNPVIYKQPQAGTLRSAGGQLLYTPVAGYVGQVQFEYYQIDGVGNRSNIALATINIVTPNDLPVISSIANQSFAEDGQATIAFTVTDTETPASSLTLNATSSNSTLFNNAALSITGSGSNRQITLTPAINKHGSSNVVITVSDGVNTVSQSFTATVTPVNDSPEGQVTLSGGAFVGETLVASSSVTDNDGINGEISWRWLRDGQLIQGADTSSFVLSNTDVGSRLIAEITYTDNDGTKETVSSVQTDVVAIPLIQVVMSELSLDSSLVLLGSAPVLTFTYENATRCFNSSNPAQVFWNGIMSSGSYTGALMAQSETGTFTLSVRCENETHNLVKTVEYDVEPFEAEIYNPSLSETSISLGESISVTFDYVNASKCYNGNDETEVFYEGMPANGQFIGVLEKRYVSGTQNLNLVCSNPNHSTAVSLEYQVEKLAAPANLTTR